MTSTSNLNSHIYQLTGVGCPTTELSLGVEVELEGTLPTSLGSDLWKCKGEDSLRGGYEYTFAKPLTPAKAADAIEDFASLINNESYKPATSLRTSTHMHVDVRPYTQKQIYQMMCLYYLVEELLVKTQPTNRQGNLFCLRMSDCEGILSGILRSLRGDSGVFFFDQSRYKYAAMNLAAIGQFGSLEFRFMQAYTKASDLKRWASILTRLIAYGRDHTADAIISEYDLLPVKQFLNQIFGVSNTSYLIGNKTEEQINVLLHTNYDNVYGIRDALFNRRFQMPTGFWYDDGVSPSGGNFGSAVVFSDGLAGSNPPPPDFIDDDMGEEVPSW